MGKCVSKHPSVLTIALSEKDLAAANQIWSKFAASSEYIALKDEHGNQICEYYYVTGKKQTAKPNEAKQPEKSLSLYNAVKTSVVGATQPCGQNPNQNWNNHKGNAKWQKSTGRQLSTQSNENKSDQRATNIETAKTPTTTSVKSTVNIECTGFDRISDEVANVGAAAYTVVTTFDDTNNDGQLYPENDYQNVAEANDEVNKSYAYITTVDSHKSQQHCLAHLRLLATKQTGGDTIANFSADANNNGNATTKCQERCTNNQQKQLRLKNGEVPKFNIVAKNVAKVADNNSGANERLSGSDHLAEAYEEGIQGQTESKKHSKKHGVSAGITSAGIGIVETKGTAMSFGFRKKLNTTPKKLKKFLEAGVGSVTGSDAKKKQDKCNNITTIITSTIATSDGDISREDNEKTGIVINDTVNEEAPFDEQQQDDNGNAELLAKVHFEKMGAAAIITQRSNQPATPAGGQPANLPGAGSRFGYRGANMLRPASAGLTSHCQMDMQENMENNNNDGNTGSNNCRVGAIGANGQSKPLVSNLKRRSKSAHAGRAMTLGSETSESGSGSDATGRPKITQPKSITFNLSQNSTIEYQRRQFFDQPSSCDNYNGGRSNASGWAYQPTHQLQQHQSRNVINTGIHTNVIVRPTPRAPPASYSKFTLHTVSLPKPEFPVAISVGAGTPTTPGGIYTPSPILTSTATGARTKDSQQQHPLTVVASATNAHAPGGHMDLKTAKQMANNTRRGFSGSREISADSGIASMDIALDSSLSSGGGGTNAGRTASPKRSRSRPRNLQMVMNGRHKFEVRDLDDPLSSESSSIVEPLALPKLPTENQTAPLPLCGLVRSNTVLSRESYERNGRTVSDSEMSANQAANVDTCKSHPTTASVQCTMNRNLSEESEGVDEEKLYLDRSSTEKGKKFKDINTCSSKTSSPCSSIVFSWCNAGESLAVKDCSSISSSEDSNKVQEEQHKDKDTDREKDEKNSLRISVDLNDDDFSVINMDTQASTISSLTEPLASASGAAANSPLRNNSDNLVFTEIPKTVYNSLNESKFAEMALAGSTFLLDDETSPTDSLISSTESEEATSKQKKHKINEELQEKDIDEISPLEMGSPISPGTPTHASHSLSLSDCGNLIDDEIADQPALLINSETHDLVDSLASRKEKTDTPTLIETTGSIRSLKSLSKARSALQQAIELSLRTPLSLRKAVMERANSLDTLSPCESICSDDLMMDFDMNSSVDSIDRSSSQKSRSGSDLHKIGDTELFSELDRKGSDVMKELNTILRLHTNKSAENDSFTAHLPARATRLLNRSRLQQQYPLNPSAAPNAGAGGGIDSDSSKSAQSLRRAATTSRASNASTSSTSGSLPRSSHQFFQHHYTQLHRDSQSSSDDLMLYDKSFRNAMIQDVLQFKKQLLRLRRILQETETLNPFESDNGQLFASCGLDSKLLNDIDLASLTSSTTDDPIVELADLRRQVVYLQCQVDDRDRTIRLQKNQIENLESKKPPMQNDTTKECINTATQTERTRHLAYGPEGLSSATPFCSQLMRIACDFKQKSLQFFKYLATKVLTKHFATNQIQIASIATVAQRLFAIIQHKLQHFKDIFGGIVIGCLNGCATPNGGRQSCLSRINSTLQRLVEFACSTSVRFTRSYADFHSWRCLVANCRQLSCNILTCYNSNSNSNCMHHYCHGLVAYSQHLSNWLTSRVRSIGDLLTTNIFCFFHYLQRNML